MRRLIVVITSLLLTVSVSASIQAAETRELSEGRSNTTLNKVVDKPGERSEKSALRLKLAGQLKKMEEEVSATSRVELRELAVKQIEIDELDKQIAAMKYRLDNGTARRNDSSEALASMVGYKAEHYRQLPELRRLHELNEQKRQQEIDGLKRELDEANVRWIADIYADSDKYLMLAMNKFERVRKDSAWDELVAVYPEVKDVKRHDLAAFFSIMGLDHESRTDQSFYTDPDTGLMWVNNSFFASRFMSWQDTMSWTYVLYYGGYSDWRLPTKEELSAFAKQGANSLTVKFKSNSFKDTGGIYWTSTPCEDDPVNVWTLNIKNGSLNCLSKSLRSYVWPVRSVKWK